MTHCILFKIPTFVYFHFVIIIVISLLVTAPVTRAKEEISAAHDDPYTPYDSNSVTDRYSFTTNNWAVVLSASRYWHNYRHGSNALSFYHLLKDCGMLDDQIVLFMAENYACDPRNYLPGTVYNDPNKEVNLYGCDAHIDVQGNEVSTHSYKGVLQGRYSLSTPLSRRLLSTNNSNLFIYITGHGNKGLVKFHDTEVFSASELADTVAFMHSTGRYNKMLLVVDSCNAASMCMEIRSPNVVCISSSTYEENSFAHHGDEVLGIEVIDTFGYEMVQAFNGDFSTASASSLHTPMYARGSASVAKSRYSPVLDRSLGDIFGNMRFTHPGIFGAINDPVGSLEKWKLGEFFSPSYSYGVSNGAVVGERVSEGLMGRDIPVRKVFVDNI